jgi:galactokinase
MMMVSGLIGSESPADLVATRFREMFGASPRIFRAPGRVNLIGEHTDYNDGFVMPAAIDFYTWVAATKREDSILEAYSSHFDEKITLSLDALSGPPRKHWSDFPRGVAEILKTAGHKLCGANLFIHGEVPLGAGLSSSASLEIALALAFSSLSELDLPRLELVKLCQKAEHEFVGARCGIMDQFIASFGVIGHAVMLDCRSLESELVPVPEDLRLVVCNSMVKHDLASGKYNQRREDCEAGVALLQPQLPKVEALRDLTLKDLEAHKRILPPQIYRRCRHVVTENQRVLATAKALHVGDANRVGDLMYRSHASLRDDYEVSCRELDLLVNLAASSRGVYGARMTGGGFGGCTVNLVRADYAEHFQSHITQAYLEATGRTAESYIFEPADGAEAWPDGSGFIY